VKSLGQIIDRQIASTALLATLEADVAGIELLNQLPSAINI